MRSNTDLLSSTTQHLAGWWFPAIGALFVIGVLSSVASSLTFGIATLVLMGPLRAGQSNYFLKLVRNERPRFEEVFSGFNDFVRMMAIGMLFTLATLAGFLLLIIPGIIVAVSLSMSFYIALDRPDLDAPDVLRASWELVWKGGNFWKVFGFSILSGC
jgi:uncharacterized membrane protein